MRFDSKSSGFHAEPWGLQADGFTPAQQLLQETCFAQANGYIGSRGSFEEALGACFQSCEGVYLNGVYQREPIVYGESAYGFATHNHKLLQVPNGKRITVWVDGEPLSACQDKGYGYRRLDFKSGVLARVQQWETPSGKRLTIESRRFVSLACQQLMCMEYRITADNFSGEIKLVSALDAGYQFYQTNHDPRVNAFSIADTLLLQSVEQHPYFSGWLHQVKDSEFIVASVALDVLTAPDDFDLSFSEGTHCLTQQYSFKVREKEPWVMEKWIGYAHAPSKSDLSQTLLSQLEQTIKQESLRGFQAALASHREVWDDFWRASDIIIDGNPALQQGIRFNLFHVYQSTGRNGRANISAKGLAGPGYDGHYFWDTEIYVIPPLCHLEPTLARKLIEFRIHILPHAKARARQLSMPTGALYAWRTIGGEECSAYFPAGTAQYHINAAIAYALQYYLNVTNDTSLLWEGGAEMLFETARLWLHIGHFNPRKDGRFCIDGVTGPDEYTALVNNNFYTNVMAQTHLNFALEVAETLALEDEAAFQALLKKMHLTPEEFNAWQQAAQRMYLPYDDKTGLFMQDDAFLDKAVWDFDNTLPEQYPLLLHFHPLVIYRHQVLKQADVMLAMHLLGDRFSIPEKQRHLAYYEPLTTHDSSLSSCIHSILCSETGQYDKAYDFFEDTVRMDLDNHHGNSEYGVHIACMAGSWASITYGFAGLCIQKGVLRFRPYLPESWSRYHFKLYHQGGRLSVNVTAKGTEYRLLEGEALTIQHGAQSILLTAERPAQMIWFTTTEDAV